MGQTAGRLPDLLIASLMKNGTSTIGIDNQNFFDAAHPNFTASGGVTTQPNYQAGSSPSWYLIDTSQVLRPFIFQRRRPFVLTPRLSLTDPSVFDRNEFQWGTDGRCNAGYGLWQFAFRSDAQLNLANLEAARVTMANWRRPDGAPMGIKPTTLMVPTALYPVARAYCENQFDPLASALTPNTFQGLSKAVENPWLN
jgi:phage major head subunit gpT-like protein